MLSSKNRQVRCRTTAFERLENRRLLAGDLAGIQHMVFDGKYVPHEPTVALEALAEVETNATPGEFRIPEMEDEGSRTVYYNDGTQDSQEMASEFYASLSSFRGDARFSSIDGTGFASVVIDTGIDHDHPHFGPDANNDGIADRIVHSQSFIPGTPTAEDDHGHGTHVQGIAVSSDATYPGVAPNADVISLKTMGANGTGRSNHLEQALQWIVANATQFNIASVNMSLGFGGFHTEPVTLAGLGDELAALEALDVIVVSASGNSYFGRPGVAYPSADPNSLSIGSERSSGGLSFFSQRDPELTSVFAPGEVITAAWPGGGVRGLQGTSMATPQVAGLAVIAQQLATRELGRRLDTSEFNHLLRMTGPDAGSIPETGASYPGVNVLDIGEAIVAMGNSQMDLAVTELLVNGGAARGDNANVSVSVTNLGSIASHPVSLDFYLSTNNEISWTGDKRLGSLAIPGLSPGQVFQNSTIITLPEANDLFWDGTTYTLGTIVDASFELSESNELNNLNSEFDRVPMEIANLSRNLRGDDLQAASTSGLWGSVVDISFEIDNLGQGPSAPSQTSVYLSRDTVIDPASDILLSTASTPRVNGTASHTHELSLDLPSPDSPFWSTATTEYFIGVYADSGETEDETNESDNRNRGIGEDVVLLTLTPPDSSIFGTVYLDEDGDGNFVSRFDQPYSVTHTWPGHINPFAAKTHTLTNLPSFRKGAELTVRVRTDVGSASNYLVVGIDTFRLNLFEGDLPEGDREVVAERTVRLEGDEWLTAISDGELNILADINFGSQFTTNQRNFIEYRLDYLPDSQTLAAPSLSVRDTVIAGSQSISFPITHQATGDVTLEIMAVGALGRSQRFANLLVEGSQQYTFFENSPASDDSLVYVQESVLVPVATFNSWAGDGLFESELSFSSGVSRRDIGNIIDVRLKYPIASAPGVAGRTISLDLNDDGTIDQMVLTSSDDPTTPSNEAGNFSLPGVPAGTHRIIFQNDQQWAATNPASGSQTVIVESGLSNENADFGVRNLPDETPPVISNVWVSSSSWSAEFIDEVDGEQNSGQGFDLLVGGDLTLPWADIDQIFLQFSEDVVNAVDSYFELRDSNGRLATTTSYDPETYRARISVSPNLSFSKLRLGVSDMLTDAAGNQLDGNSDSASGGIFNLRFDVVPGDGNRDGRVNGADLGAFTAAFLTRTGQANYNPFVDWNTDDRVNGGDLAVFAANFLNNIGTLDEPAASFSDGANGNSFKDSSFGGKDWQDGNSYFAFLGDDEEEDEFLFDDLLL